jgi:hypothetical protein
MSAPRRKYPEKEEQIQKERKEAEAYLFFMSLRPIFFHVFAHTRGT